MATDPSADPAAADPGRDPADHRTESVADETWMDSNRFTDRGEEAESSAFRGDGAYSGGDFAGGGAADAGRRPEER